MDSRYAARAMVNSTMAGIGISMEAINQNPIMYELTLSHAWESAPRPLGVWVSGWAAARYGPMWTPQRAAVVRTWQLLTESAYAVFDPTQGNGYWGVSRSVITKRPSLTVQAVINDGFGGSQLKYDACKFVTAWSTLLSAVQAELGAHPGSANGLTGSLLELDVVDLTRQTLSNHAETLYLEFVSIVAKQATTPTAAEDAGRVRDAFLELLHDVDTLLLTLEHFSFGRWERAAQALATGKSTEERALFAFNARNLVTLWGPTGQIQDYSARLWGGLIQSYYAVRWGIAMNATVDWLHKATDGAAPPNFDSAITDFSQKWQHNPAGDGYRFEATPHVAPPWPAPRSAVGTALALMTKYGGRVRESCARAI